MSTPSGLISANLFHAIQKVETGDVTNPEEAVGDGMKAIGPYQIHEPYWKDAVKCDPSLKEGGKTWQNCKGPGSFNYSERVMQAYMKCYATESRLGRAPTDEDLARIHNGGPDGYKNPATVAYWEKVQKYLC